MRGVIVCSALVVAGAAVAQAPDDVAEPNDAQILKARGQLPAVSLDEVKNFKVGQKFQAALEHAAYCSHPDHPDAVIAETEPDVLSAALGYSKDYCTHLQQMHKRMLEATGSGSWPAKCYADEYPDHHAATYYVESESFPAHYHRPVTDDELKGLVDAGVWGVETVAQARTKWDRGTLLETALALMDESFRRIGCAHIRVMESAGDNIHIKSLRIPGSTIGYAYFNDGTCGDHVTNNIDSDYRPGLHYLARLLAHEAGHNHNLPHEFSNQNHHRSIMSYAGLHGDLFRGFHDGSLGLPRDASWSLLTRFYGGEAVPVTDPDPPTPDPPTGGNVSLSVGDDLTLTLSDGSTITLTIKSLSGVTPVDMRTQVLAAITQVVEHPDRDKNRHALTIVYQGVADAVRQKQLEFPQAIETIQTLRGLLLGEDAGKWAGVFAVADKATTIDHLDQIASALSEGESIPPAIIALIKMVVELLPGGDLERLANIILAILDVFGSEDPVEPKPKPDAKPVQKASWNRSQLRIHCTAAIAV